MDYNKWAEMQHPPNPNPSTDPYAQFHNPQSSSSYPPYSFYPPHPTQNPNPNPTYTDPQTSLEHYGGVPSAQLDTSLQPPGVDSNTYQPSLAGYDVQTAAAIYYQQTQNWASATFFQDPNAVSQSWTAKEVIRQFGTDPVAYADASVIPLNGAEPSVPANLNPTQWTNAVVRPYMNGVAFKKGSKKIKKTKIVQSAYCEVCKIDCNSRDVLDLHKLGKKHKKNLEKIDEAKRIANLPAPVAVARPPPAPVVVTPPPAPVAVAPPPVVTKPIIGPPENPAKKKKAAPSSAAKENLDSKRKKLMEGGAAAEAVRVCTICNVACNSQTVFNYHLAGQKHASMVKKLAAGTSAVGTQV